MYAELCSPRRLTHQFAAQRSAAQLSSRLDLDTTPPAPNSNPNPNPNPNPDLPCLHILVRRPVGDSSFSAWYVDQQLFLSFALLRCACALVLLRYPPLTTHTLHCAAARSQTPSPSLGCIACPLPQASKAEQSRATNARRAHRARRANQPASPPHPSWRACSLSVSLHTPQHPPQHASTTPVRPAIPAVHMSSTAHSRALPSSSATRLSTMQHHYEARPPLLVRLFSSSLLTP